MIEWYEIKDDDCEMHEIPKENKFKKKMRKLGWWVSEHMDEVVVLAPICITGATLVTRLAIVGISSVANTVNKGIKGVAKNANLKREEKLKELYCYDPSLGHYWRLKRKLTNSEWVKIDKRKQNGERLSDILNDMKVLY